jgi:hypothetical protein
MATLGVLMSKLVICTGSDSNLFFLAKGLILSLRRILPIYDAELVFFDLGCTPQELAWLQARTHRILIPKDDLEVAGLAGYAPHKLGLTIRPFLPHYAPGYDIYLWIDADAWVQDPSVIQFFIRGAEKGAAAVSPEVDSAYPFMQHLPSAIQFQRYKFGQWADAFGEDVARRMSLLPLINAGVYAINADPLLWEKWAENFRLTLLKGMTGLCDQVALQKTLVELNRMHALPSRANWMSHYALPHRRAEDGVWIEPRFAGQPIGIVHLVAAVRRETYLRHGMLYDDGDYLSPEEVPENLRAAFLAGRRKPIIGAPPDA